VAWSFSKDKMNESICGEQLPVIHIGMPKTATKTLQWRVFAEHSDIFYLGRYDGPGFREKHRKFQACRDEHVFKVMDQIAYSGIHHPNISQCRDLLRTYFGTHNPDYKQPVWSWESYCTDSRINRELRARNLKDVFGSARILVTIRNPKKLLESAFLQQLKRDNIGAGYKRGRGIFYTSIDQWLQRDKGGDITNHLDYAETIRMYVDQFGVENVCVQTFEQLLHSKEVFFENLSSFMGIDSEETLSLVDTNVDNSRWSATQLDRLSSINSSPRQALEFRLAGKEKRRKMLDIGKGGVPKNPGEKATAPISTAWQQRIVDRTREGTQWLDETFQLGLQELGYLGE
jgi:hypothetical protein